MSTDPRSLVTTHILTEDEVAELHAEGIARSRINEYGGADVQRWVLWVVSALGMATQPPRDARAWAAIAAHRVPGAVEALGIVFARGTEGAAAMSSVLAYLRSIGVVQ